MNNTDNNGVVNGNVNSVGNDTVVVGNDAPINQNVTVSNTSNVTTSSDIMSCPKCGGEMKKNARYCMKCGNLNYAHPDNESMKQYAWQNIKQGYFISGANIDKEEPLTMTKANANSVSEYNPFRTCLIINIVLHVLLAVLFLLLVLLIGGSLNVVYIVGVLLSVGYLFLFDYSMQRILIKGGQPWWSYFVPIYGFFTFFAVAMSSGWFFLLLLIPVVGFVVSLVALYNLGKRFYKSGILTMLFPFVMIPVIGLDKNSEFSIFAQSNSLTDNSVDASGKTKSERAYGKKKLLLTLTIVIVIGVVLFFGWSYIKPLLQKGYEFFMEQMEFYK